MEITMAISNSTPSAAGYASHVSPIETRIKQYSKALTKEDNRKTLVTQIRTHFLNLDLSPTLFTPKDRTLEGKQEYMRSIFTPLYKKDKEERANLNDKYLALLIDEVENEDVSPTQEVPPFGMSVELFNKLKAASNNPSPPPSTDSTPDSPPTDTTPAQVPPPAHVDVPALSIISPSPFDALQEIINQCILGFQFPAHAEKFEEAVAREKKDPDFLNLSITKQKDRIIELSKQVQLNCFQPLKFRSVNVQDIYNNIILKGLSSVTHSLSPDDGTQQKILAGLEKDFQDVLDKYNDKNKFLALGFNLKLKKIREEITTALPNILTNTRLKIEQEKDKKIQQAKDAQNAISSSSQTTPSQKLEDTDPAIQELLTKVLLTHDSRRAFLDELSKNNKDTSFLVLSRHKQVQLMTIRASEISEQLCSFKINDVVAKWLDTLATDKNKQEFLNRFTIESTSDAFHKLPDAEKSKKIEAIGWDILNHSIAVKSSSLSPSKTHAPPEKSVSLPPASSPLPQGKVIEVKEEKGFFHNLLPQNTSSKSGGKSRNRGKEKKGPDDTKKKN